jgi:hypothetical protein
VRYSFTSGPSESDKTLGFSANVETVVNTVSINLPVIGIIKIFALPRFNRNILGTKKEYSKTPFFTVANPLNITYSAWYIPLAFRRHSPVFPYYRLIVHHRNNLAIKVIPHNSGIICNVP